MCEDLGWKLAVGFDPESDCFTLEVNGVPVMNLPFQATAALAGPQIFFGSATITLNDQVIEFHNNQWSST